MLKLFKAYLYSKLEPTREEKIAAARKLLAGTGYHVRRIPTHEAATPLFSSKVIPAGRFSK
jgi:hypothetical protein